jgi:hypothetical protein
MIDPTKVGSIDPPSGGEHLNILISDCGTKVWVCIDGAAVFRYRNLRKITMENRTGRPIPFDGSEIYPECSNCIPSKMCKIVDPSSTFCEREESQ